MRVLFYTLLGLLITIGLLVAGWIAWSRQKLEAFRLTDAQMKAAQDSQRGRRPMWRDPMEPRQK